MKAYTPSVLFCGYVYSRQPLRWPPLIPSSWYSCICIISLPWACAGHFDSILTNRNVAEGMSLPRLGYKDGGIHLRCPSYSLCWCQSPCEEVVFKKKKKVTCGRLSPANSHVEWAWKHISPAAPVKPSDETLAPATILTIHERLWSRDTQLSSSWILDPQNNEVINVHSLSCQCSG